MIHLRLAGLALLLAFCACGSPAREQDVARRVARDTVQRVWKQRVRVDSVARARDTTLVWVMPADWIATDPPSARVRVGPDGRVVSIDWIPGG